MSARFPTILAVALLGGCAATGAQGERTISYRCDRGTLLRVVFGEQEATVTSGDSEPMRLAQEPSGSGFSYRSATHWLRGKGDEATWTVGRMAPEECRVAPKPR